MNILDVALGFCCGLVVLGGLGSLHYALELNFYGVISAIGASLVGVIGICVSTWANTKYKPFTVNDKTPKESVK